MRLHIHWFRLAKDYGWSNRGGIISHKRVYKCRFCPTRKLTVSGTFTE